MFSRFIAPMAIVAIVGTLLTTVVIDSVPAGADATSNRMSFAAAGTPVAPEPTDPLDGDPLDGQPAHAGVAKPDAVVLLDFVRSGRPADAPNSLTAYDGDPQTVWSAAESDEAWLWFDLGEKQPLREVRWLPRGDGMVQIEISSNREAWQAVAELPVREGWQRIEVRDDARYVRLTLAADGDAPLPTIAEVAAYGGDDDGSASLAQKAKSDKKKKGKRERTRDDTKSSGEKEREPKPARGAGTRGTRAEGGVTISAEPGETNCRGKKSKCRAEEGEVSIDENGCDGEGSCTIDIVADGGTATCESSGGDKNKAGRGRGKSEDNGGRCEAIANGGAVTIGDIDPQRPQPK